MPANLQGWHEMMRGAALAPAAAYARAVIAEKQRGVDHGLGYRLYAVTNSRMDACDVSIKPGGHVVIGRHTSCDLVIDSDAVSLRHLLVRASLLDDGMPVLSLLDLDSSAGFELSDGLQKRAIVGTGPFVFRIGSTWCVALPKGSPVTTELLPPSVSFSDSGSHRIDPRMLGGPSPTRATSRITSIPWCVPLTDRNSDVSSDIGADGRAFRYEVMIEVGGAAAGVRFSERDLDHGILVGRADRCADEGLKRVLRQNCGISRVHALVIRERDGIRLYDVASLNGILNDAGVRVRSLSLHEQGMTTLYFAGKAPATMRFTVLPNSR